VAAGAMSKRPLVVITGPTASGKTSLAIRLAQKYNGEIICADSRSVYVGMDIGTAKPTAEERASVPHWGLDLREPDQPYSVADFKQYADSKIEEIRNRGHVPFLVGGTGLYIDAVLFSYQFGPPADIALRQKLEALSKVELHDYCKKNNVILPENIQNKRYLIRAIEKKNTKISKRTRPIQNTIIVGIATNRDVLRTQIVDRAEQLFDNGVVEEATLLGKKYGWNAESMTGNIYPLVHLYLLGEMTIAEIKLKFTTLDWRLAKRQLTWLRRNPYITWLPLSEAGVYIERILVNI
jgi:tRNA dimethylallyltransferase